MVLPPRVREEVTSRLTLLTPEPTEAGVALAGVVVDGLHTFSVAAAGCWGTGRCRKQSTRRMSSLDFSHQCATEMSPVTQTLPEVLRKAVPGSTVVNLGVNVQIQDTWLRLAPRRGNPLPHKL